MIDFENLLKRKYHYLDGDETLIENYDKAIADTTQTWVCHHRRELYPDRKTAEDLKVMNLYWNRPPEELIFLTNEDHMRLHGAGENNPMHGKSSWENCTDEQRADRIARYSEHMKGKNKGKHMFTNGIITKFCYECPEGFWPGSGETIKTQKGKIWVNDGQKMKLVNPNEIPDGFKPGKLKISEETRRKISEAKKRSHSKSTTGYHWWNNGEKTSYSKECPGPGWKMGILRK